MTSGGILRRTAPPRVLPWVVAVLCVLVALADARPAAALEAPARPGPAPIQVAPVLENGGYSGVMRVAVTNRCLLLSGVTDRRWAQVAICPGAGWARQLHLPLVFHTNGPPDTPPAPEVPLTSPVWDGVARNAHVPILMYHHVGPLPPGSDSIRQGLTVSEANFRAQMDYLKSAGYQPVTLTALVNHLAVGTPLPDRPIVLTFDDGYRDFYDVVLPILRDYEFVATLFLVTAPIDDGSPDFVTWDQVREMHAAGIEMGAHSYTHPDLSGQLVDYLVWQILGSKEAIEERIEEPVRFFAYPSGAYDDDTVQVVRSAGFWGAVTVEKGCRHTEAARWSLDRIRIQPYDTIQSFASKLDECREG
jgi:peptidoglycan/xylan/chitin deacetylase (PgdA/CDA1 family)